MRGKLIVFEGISGTGKETQAKLLQQYLSKKRIKSCIVFHPSPSLKSKLRRAKTQDAQIVLLAKDRLHVVQYKILPALLRGEWVISLRNYISAYVYQGNGKEVEMVDVQPDALFLFDIEPEESLKRIMHRGEPVGMYETMDLLYKNRKRYKQILKNIPYIMIDSSGTIGSIHDDIRKHINMLIR